MHDPLHRIKCYAWRYKFVGMLVMVCESILALLAPKAMLATRSDWELSTSNQQLQIMKIVISSLKSKLRCNHVR